MELSKQVVSLENAKKLKELGVKQESMFYWVARGEHYCMTDRVEEREPTIEQSKPPYDFPYISKGSAYTASELMEILPHKLSVKPIMANCNLRVHKNESDYYGADYILDDGLRQAYFISLDRVSSLPDALALLLIHLIENNLWKPEK